ncbi:DUF4236 domain-containing protein [Mycolicibacter senuensis]|uniref:DUF4236 domain-containing protein n=1 Tax=Mycolicibacter senuensis TaxID=386913 RepID=UPI000A14BF2C|nr:DUF4236 domain-containing protein [Mycolicibacter senuensis]MDQ2627848.1 DUF4236 domain-containing protein [Actinomycetota bacterium]
MGLVFRRRVKIGKRTGLNLSKSGASVSRRGKRVSVSSKGRGSVRIAKGVSWRF